MCVCVCLCVYFIAIELPTFYLEDLCQPRKTAINGSLTEVLCLVYESDNVHLNCSYDASPLGTLSLFFNNSDISLTKPSNVEIDSNNAIVITNFNPMLNGGVYECKARNIINNMVRETTLKYIVSGMIVYYPVHPIRQHTPKPFGSLATLLIFN